MCHRVVPFAVQELEAALAALRAGGPARVGAGTGSEPDAYPGVQLPLFVPDADGTLEVAELTWGFEMPGDRSERGGRGSRKGRLVFNTRLETARGHLRRGRGMWAAPLERGRCLVPVRAFYEGGRSAPGGAQVRFELAGHGGMLLAGVAGDGRFSIVTTAPNAQVAPVHDRMPLVLGPGESRLWLAGEFERLVDRSGVPLCPVPEG